jgi:protein tyrosine kinase modulator
LEKMVSSDPNAVQGVKGDDGKTTSNNTGTRKPLFDTLVTQRESVKKELESATQKLAAARLGESLERGQHSERLEVIEQPTLPRTPVSPNRLKIFAFVFIFAGMASGGLALGAEMLNPAIRRTSDLLPVIDSNLLVAIPYITTTAETYRKKRRILLTIVIALTLILVAVIAILYFLPPLDILFQKVVTKLLSH